MSAAPVRAYIALGSNLGDREAYLNRALDLMAAIPETRILRVSDWYENPAEGIENGYDFLNGVAEIETQLPPRKLLQALQRIERECGRTHTGTGYQNRTLDLDLLLYGDAHIEEEDLVVPHPRMRERDFVLIPLGELGVTLSPDSL